jgi:hypothetical protein
MIKTKEEIAEYNKNTAEEVAGVIIDHFNKKSAELETLVEGDELAAELGHAHLGAYLKATSNSFAGFVGIMTDTIDDASYEVVKGQFMTMVSNMLDESRRIARETNT